MEYYTKAIEILDKQIKESKTEHLIGKHSLIYETSLKAIIEALILTSVGYCLPDKEVMIIEMHKIVKANYEYNTEIEKANFRIGWQEHYLWLKNRYK